MNKLFLVLILCAVAAPQMAAASDHDVQEALDKQFKNKVLILRHPLMDESLHYDADGKSLNQGPEGAWTIYGAVQVRKIELSENELRLQGRRLYVHGNKNGLAPSEYTQPKNGREPIVNPSVKVEINAGQPLDTVEQAQILLGNVFALNKADFLDSVPEFWRGYLDGYFEDYDFRQGTEMEFKARKSYKRSDLPPQIASGQSPFHQVTRELESIPYHVGKDVKAPKVKSTPEPEFSDAARQEKFTGVLMVDVVVDSAGNVNQVKLLRPLGLGLDESAVATIKNWTFEPAMYKGTPVAVEMNVEVSFMLK